MALQAGADPNTRGVWATFLQIAVASRDLAGVQCLIEAGADINGLGDEGAEMWEGNTYMGRFNCLHDLSPLYICRTSKCLCFQEIDWEEDSLSAKGDIKKVLLSSGAKETARDGPYLDYEYRVNYRSNDGYNFWARWVKGELCDEGEEEILTDTESESVSEEEAQGCQ